MIRDRRIALAFRAGSFIFAVIGLLSVTGVFRGSLSLDSFMYYTVQSNLLAAVLFAVLTVQTARDLRENPRGGAGRYSRFGMICAVDLMVTFAVFWLLLSPSGIDASYLMSFENHAIHTVTPLLCLADYILFSEPRRLKYRDVYYVCIFPLGYAVFSFIAGLSGYVYGYRGVVENPLSSYMELVPVRAPYFFLDFDELGFGVLLYVAAITSFFLLIGHIIYFIDRRLRKPRG